MQIFTSYKVKIIRSEKEFSKTAKVYQSALHYLLDVVAHEWPMLKNVKGEPEKGGLHKPNEDASSSCS